MQPNSRLFLETTIQIERFSAHREEKEKIDKIISQFSQILSSTYVKMEFRRRFIQDLVYLYNEALLGAQTFADVFLRIDKLNSDYHKRKIKGIIASLCRFFSDTKEEEISGPWGKGLLEKAVAYFRQAIEIAWERFDEKIDILLNETDCSHAKTGPVLTEEKFDNRMSKCKKADIRCKIVKFFVQNNETFRKIYERLSKMGYLDDEQGKVKNILEKALKYPENMADRQNCWNCGDAIIAGESPEDAVLFTTNIKHFEPMCSEIGKKCIKPY
jgi:hypothetical protein